MGKKAQPKHLAKKLWHIRKYFELSQNDMAKIVKVDDSCDRSRISKFERGLAVPTLLELLRYARYADKHGGSYDTNAEDLIDDSTEISLPINGK